MNITDLITKLIALRAEHGDVGVIMEFDCCCYGTIDYDPDPKFGGNFVVL